MIRLEVTCDFSDQPRARDVKHPCESLRGRSLAVDSIGVIADAQRALERAVEKRGWKRWIIPALGRRKGYICGPCYARAKGDV